MKKIFTFVADIETTNVQTSMGMSMDIGQETISDICKRTGKNVESVRKQWARKMSGTFDRTYCPTIDELVILNLAVSPRRKMKRVDKPAAAKELPSDILQEGKTTIEEVKKQGSPLLLWGCLLLSLACSVPNMYGVALAMKGSELLAIMVTAAFTIAPFLLIAYGIKGALQYAAYVPILVEVFCNSAGFFGGMTGLGHSLYIEPTPFLHMVTSMTNSANEPTAFILAVCMAICIAILAIVPVYEIEKRASK